MGRRVKHIHAKPNEYVVVHRGGGGGRSDQGPGGGNGESFGLIGLILLGLIIFWGGC